MDLTSIHHVAIPIKNVDRAVDWYRSHFNCEVVYQDQTWALLRFANIYLALVTPTEHPPHLAFVHPDITEFGQPKTHRDGTASVYIKDSENNAIEMLSPVGLEDLK